MQRRFRFRRMFKWTGTIASVVIAFVLIASAWVSAAYAFPLPWSPVGPGLYGPARQSLTLQVFHGRLSVIGYDAEWPPDSRHVFCRLAGEVGLRWWPGIVLDLAPHILSQLGWVVRIACWVPLLTILMPTLLLWRLDRRRAASGCCTKCGYNLTGNVTGRCPECGAACGA